MLYPGSGVQEDWEDPSEKIMEEGHDLSEFLSQAKGSRPAFLHLEAEGCTVLPPIPGFFLSYHSLSKQWHAGYPYADNKGHMNRAPSWGEGLRTERQALIIALRFLWHLFYTKTGEGMSQLEKLEHAAEK